MVIRKAIIFDMDGVGINSEPLYDLADVDFLRRKGITYNRESIANTLLGKSLRDTTQILKDIHSITGTTQNLMEERLDLIEGLYQSSLSYITGFLEIHQYLIERSIKTCIATASHNRLLDVADKKLGLSNIFGQYIFKISDVGDKSKPDPAIFLYAAEKLETKPEECCVIEDSPNGIMAAKNAGMYCIGITTSRTSKDLGLADVVVSSHNEIIQLFKQSE